MSRKAKTVTLAMILLCVTFMYGVHHFNEYHTNKSEVHGGRLLFQEAYSKHRSKSTENRKLVILYSNQRSGSSFVGEFFNKNPSAFYLFEPLFPFTPHCGHLDKERVVALERMLKCDFSQNTNFFKLAMSVRKFGDGESKCVSNKVCFALKSDALKRLYLRHHARNSTEMTWNSNLLSKVCNQSSLVVYKVLRICSLDDINDLYIRLTKEGMQVYIIHLLRDPRGTISSKLQLELKQNKMEIRTKELCGKIERDMKLVENTSEILNFVKDGRYMLVRYEDAATDPVTVGRRIYSFIGLNLPEDVHKWLNISVAVSSKSDIIALNNDKIWKSRYFMKAMKSTYGTIKDSSITTRKWRKMLPLRSVLEIQNICSAALEKLSYKFVWSEESLLDFNEDVWR